MKKIISTVIVIFLMILSFGLCGVASAQDSFEISLEQFNEKGDFLEVNMEMNEEYEVSMTGHMRIEMTDIETITVKDNSYDCQVASMKGSGDIDYYSGPEGTWKVTGKMYIDKLTENTVKTTSTRTIIVKYLGETMTMVREVTTILISKDTTWTSQDDPEIGNSWTVTIEEETEETETIESPEGKKTESNTITETTVTECEYLKDETITTGLGTFNCRVIKDQEEYFYGEYSYEYLDKNNNLPIRSEMYEDYELYNEMELIAYRMGGESVGNSVIGDIGSGSEDKDDEDEEGLLGMGKMGGIDTFLILLIVFIVLIVIILGIFAMRRSRKAAAPSTGQQSPGEYAPPGYHQAPQPQAPPPPPPPPPQSYQDTQRYCPSCGQSLNYMQQYQKWYCYTCQKYE